MIPTTRPNRTAAMETAPATEIVTGIADQVVFTRKQVSDLARAAGVTPDDVRESMRTMPSKVSFPMSLAYVHMLRHPVIVRIRDENQRSYAAVREAASLVASWDADPAVAAIVAAGRRQAGTGPVPGGEPQALTSWNERVMAKIEAPAPKLLGR